MVASVFAFFDNGAHKFKIAILTVKNKVLLFRVATNMTSRTCQVMSEVAKYVGYFSSNISHKPNQCQVVNEDLCNSISCSSPENPTGFYNMSFLPCGQRIGYNTLSGHNETSLSYNFTIFNSSVINYTEHISGNVTLVQQRGKKAVTFQVCGNSMPRQNAVSITSYCLRTNSLTY